MRVETKTIKAGECPTGVLVYLPDSNTFLHVDDVWVTRNHDNTVVHVALIFYISEYDLNDFDLDKEPESEPNWYQGKTMQVYKYNYDTEIEVYDPLDII